jgi:hypothetical protein
MNIASRARTGLALAACLAVAAGANAAPIDLGSTPTPLGDDHARTTATTSTPVAPTGAVRDDHARTDPFTIPPHGTISVPVAPDRVPAATVSANSDGFDWSDAGIGFGTAIGFALLAGGTMVLARWPRSPHTPAI